MKPHRLNQSEAFEIRGQWWRADGRELLDEFRAAGEPTQVPLERGFAYLQGDRDRLEGIDFEHACRGPLKFDPEDAMRLDLLGSSDVAFPEDDSGYTIHGVTASGVPCSLLDCFVTNVEGQFPSGFADRSILGHVFVRGAHVASRDELHADRMLVRVQGLLDFLWAPVHDESGKAYPGLGHHENEDVTVRLDGAELNFAVGETRRNETHVRTLEREAAVEIKLDHPATFKDLSESWIEPLIRLSIFGSRQPVTLEALSFIESDPEGEDQSLRELQVIQLQRKQPREPKLRPHKMLLSYAAVRDHFVEFIEAWWSVSSRLAGVGDFLFGVLRERMSLEPQLVTLVSVAEGYHRAFHGGMAVEGERHDFLTAEMIKAIESDPNKDHYARRLRHAAELTQQDRLLAVLRRAGTVVQPLGIKAGRLAERAVGARNYFVHLEEDDDENGKPHDLQGHLYEANQLLILALNCNLLLDLGTTAEEAFKGVQRAYGGEPFWSELQRRGAAWPKRTSP